VNMLNILLKVKLMTQAINRSSTLEPGIRETGVMLSGWFRCITWNVLLTTWHRAFVLKWDSFR
jgi:hypothetical protein